MRPISKQVAKIMVEQAIFIEGIFLGIYGNWIIETVKIIKLYTLSGILIATSLWLLIAFFLFRVTHIETLFIKTISMLHIASYYLGLIISSTEIESVFFWLGAFCWILINIFENQRYTFSKQISG